MGQHVREGRRNHSLGIAGCGRMGKPMLAALRRAGFKAKGFDVRSDLGPEIGTDAKVFAADLTTLITVVRDARQTDDLLFEKQKIVSLAPAMSTLVVSSTLSPNYILALRERLPDRVALIDAPMSGAQVRAEAGTLSFMLGGDDAILDELQPMFSAMGSSFHRMGASGQGMTAKVLNNLLAASSTAMTRLVLDWADTAGLDEKALLNLIHNSSGQNWFSSGYSEIEFAADGYGEDNSIGILAKDVEAALDIAPTAADTTLPEVVQSYIRNMPKRGIT